MYTNRHNKNLNRDSWMRSWTKSFTWRSLGIILLMALSYIVTKSWTKASLITMLFNSIQIFMYVVHERIWTHIEWGRGSVSNRFWFYFWFVVMVLLFGTTIVLGGIKI